MLAGMGLKVVTAQPQRDRSSADTDILLGDTIGEMGLYLRLTEIAFVGRSLTAEGGQNPLEPAMLDTAVLAGRQRPEFPRGLSAADRQRRRQAGARPRHAGGRGQFPLEQPRRPPRHDRGRAPRPSTRCAARSTARSASLDPFIQPLIVKSRLRNGNGRPFLMASEAPPFWWQAPDWRAYALYAALGGSTRAVAGGG